MEVDKILLDTYNMGVIKGLELAESSLIDFIKIKQEKHNGNPIITMNELNVFMGESIKLYKEHFKKG